MTIAWLVGAVGFMIYYYIEDPDYVRKHPGVIIVLGLSWPFIMLGSLLLVGVGIFLAIKRRIYNGY